MVNEFVYESATLMEKGTKSGRYVIRVPVVWAAEIIKDYPEHDSKMFMPYAEIEKIASTHKEFTITENHVQMTDKAGNILPIPKELNIGAIRQIIADPKCACGRGMAFINKNKISEFVANMLLRGGVIGISGGGFAGNIGPGGHHKGENYAMAQLDVKMHHMALVTHGIPRCPTNVCGFNLEAFIDVKSGGLNACASHKIPIFKSEHPDWTQAHVVAAAMGYCRSSLGIKSSFIFENDSIAPDAFMEFYEYLIFENIIEREDCVHDFYIEFQNEWLASESVGIIKGEDQSSIINQNLLKIAENKMADEILLKKIEELEAKNKELQDAQLKGAAGTIEQLRESNAKVLKENADLKVSLIESNKIVKEIRDRKGVLMYKALIEAVKSDGTPIYQPQELAQLSYEKLEETFNTAKRFLQLPELDNSALLVQPQFQPVPFMNQAPIPFYPNNQGYSIPLYAPQVPTGSNTQPQMYDAAGNIMKDSNALQQSRVIQQPIPVPGSVPSPDELFDEKNPRWKSDDPNEDKNYNHPGGII